MKASLNCLKKQNCNSKMEITGNDLSEIIGI